MGNIFSFFNKPKGTREQLEDLENEIDKIEEYKISASVRERNFHALLIVSSVIIYLIGIGYLYFDYNHSKSYVYKTVALLFLLLVPPTGYYAKNLVAIYYKWVKETNDMKRTALLKLKKKILSKVQETETFNDAKMILERFAPNELRNMSMSLNNLHQLDRDTSFNTAYLPSSRPSAVGTQHNTSRILSPPNRPLGGGGTPGPLPAIGGPPASNFAVSSFNAPQNVGTTPARHGMSRTVKPILPQNRSVVEKVVDYIFADGPSNRYALVCGRCFAHNGMALPDEFEYISYICAYCGHFNPARKMRPSAPKMDLIHAPKAIEGPKVEEADEGEGSTVKITELSTELNKSTDAQTAETSKRETTLNKSSQSKGPSISLASPDSNIPFADSDPIVPNDNDNHTASS